MSMNEEIAKTLKVYTLFTFPILCHAIFESCPPQYSSLNVHTYSIFLQHCLLMCGMEFNVCKQRSEINAKWLFFFVACIIHFVFFVNCLFYCFFNFLTFTIRDINVYVPIVFIISNYNSIRMCLVLLLSLDTIYIHKYIKTNMHKH